MASLSDYQQYLNFIASKYGGSIGPTEGYAANNPGASVLQKLGYDDGTNPQDMQTSQDFLSHPGGYGLYNFDYNPATHPNGDYNPYYNIQVRDYVRGVAKQLGLSNEAANNAALSVAQQHYQQSGQPYGAGDHPMVIADGILKNLYAQAGQPYQGLTQEQITHYNNVAGDFETQLKAYNQDTQNAQDVSEGLQIASVVAPAFGGAFGGAAGAGGDVAIGDDVLAGGDAGTDLLGSGGGLENPYLDPSLASNVNPTFPDAADPTYSFPTSPTSPTNVDPTFDWPGATPTPDGAISPMAGPDPFPASPDASLGSSGLGGIGTGVAAGLGAGAANNALNSDSGDEQQSGSGGTSGGSGSDALLNALLGGGAAAGGINLGALLGAGLGYAGSKEQTDAYKDLAQQYINMGQPYRDQLSQLYANPDTFLHSAAVTTPVQMGTDALAKALSVKGNPFGSGTALQSLQDYATQGLYGQLSSEKDRLANYGGLAKFSSAAPSASMAGINASGGMYDAAGYGLANLMSPQNSLPNFLKQQYGIA